MGLCPEMMQHHSLLLDLMLFITRPLFQRRSPAFGLITHRHFHPAPVQRFAQQHFDLGIGTAKISRRRPLDRRKQCRVETQRKGFFGQGLSGAVIGQT